ncbi:hypothetical protein JI739_03290 [Ramlibacter sp. AW1]|uniref:PKD domain-containing protein n=1 Tax=Ramlibacter aurantiacus TaxID=2801330 RepID=A0A936ZLC9_9BURK|nr:hypothetical protein [Ramlibacter aurantiacus]MBL0419365.1 hypothetical protein [Ramlibacter aurantiacus]
MKRLLSLLLIAWPALLPAQAPSGISFNREPARVNEAVHVTLNFEAATPLCALWVDFGDGDQRHVLVERFPVTLVKHYTTAGRYPVRAEGRGMLRGLSSSFGCAGAPRTRTLTVVGPEAASPTAQPPATERPPVGLPPVIDLEPRQVRRPGTTAPPPAASPAPAPPPAPAPGRSRDDSLRVF